MSKKTEKQIKVTQTGSHIGREPGQEANLKGLGLGKIGRSKTLESTAAVHGMIDKVRHLVKVEEV